MNFSKGYLFIFTFLSLLLCAVFLNTSVNAQNSPKPSKVLKEIVKRPFKSVCDKSGKKDNATCHAKVTTLDDGVTPLAGSIPFSSSLTPAGIHSAYQLPCTPGGAVSGICATPAAFSPTIAIVIAYHSPTLENDLNVYSNYFSISSCTKANGCLQVVNQNGGNTLPITVNGGWAMEEAMDVQIAHATCQTCKILVVEANSNSFIDLGSAVNTAANMGAKAISNSYGAGEWSGEKTYDVFYNHPGSAVTVSSGDNGYGAEYPASSPYAVSVGGTTLNLFTDLTYASETVWSGAGSGCSSYETANSWQTSLSEWSTTGCGSSRAVSDVSAVADPNTGAAVYDTTPYNGQTGWWQIGGTSLSAPLIAGAFGLGGTIPAGVNGGSILYNNNNTSNFHDITSGSNGSCNTVMCKGVVGFDGPTGLGTPNGLGGFGGMNISLTPTATPTPTLSPTPTPTVTPTATPTPTLSPTPTPIDTQPPTVAITNPSNGSRVWRNNTVTIKASATDNVVVSRVEFYVNGTLLSSDLTSPYTASWRVPNVKGVVYTISAKAYDTSGNSAQANISVTSR